MHYESEGQESRNNMVKGNHEKEFTRGNRYMKSGAQGPRRREYHNAGN